jgi:hypothetical protein
MQLQLGQALLLCLEHELMSAPRAGCSLCCGSRLLGILGFTAQLVSNVGMFMHDHCAARNANRDARSDVLLLRL